MIPSGGGDRGGVDAERHQQVLNAATVPGVDEFSRLEREMRERELELVREEEEEARHVAEQCARAMALNAQARTDVIRSAGTVGVVGLACLILGGPVLAVVGTGAVWLLDSYRDPYGR